MPVGNYDRWFSGKKGSATKVKRSLVKQHGEPKATRIFMSMVNKRRAKGGLKGRIRGGRS